MPNLSRLTPISLFMYFPLCLSLWLFFSHLSCILSDTATEAKDGRHSSRSVRLSQASPLIIEPSIHSRASHGKGLISNCIHLFHYQISLDIMRPSRCNFSSFSIDIPSVRVSLLFFFLPAEEIARRSSSRASMLSNPPSDRLQAAADRSRPNSPDPLESAVTEMFISEENISKMENLLDTWSNNLKVSLLLHTV